MMKKNIVIIGAGGFGREVAWLIARINEYNKNHGVNWTYRIQGYLDDNVTLIGKNIGLYGVLGTIDEAETVLSHRIDGSKLYITCAIANTKIRKKMIIKLRDRLSKLSGCSVTFPNLIDPAAVLSDQVTIGEGNIICAGCVVSVDVHIGDFNIFDWNSTIGHDDVIKDYVTLYPNVNVSGNVILNERAEIGTGTQIIQGKTVGKGCILGAGAVVIDDMPEECTAVGVPAKVVKRM